MDEHGRLTRKVLEYQELMKQLVPTVRTPEDWTPLVSFAAIDEFERIGTFLEVQNWQQYTQMLTQWAGAIDAVVES